MPFDEASVWGENAEYVRKALDIANVHVLRVEDGECAMMWAARLRHAPVCLSYHQITRASCANMPSYHPTLISSPAEGVVAADPSGRAKDVVPGEPAVFAYAKDGE